MAAHSGGVEWTSIVKPILSGSFGTFTKAELLELVKAIIKSENEILEHDVAFEPFYLAFTVVAADYISANCTLLSKNQLTLASQACGVLITYILQQLRFGLPRGESALSVKQLLAPLTALCAGTTALSSSELVTLTTVMKNTKLPDHIKTNVTPSYEKETPKQDSSKRSRSDLAASIVEQFSTPLGSICHIEGSMGTSSISSTIPLSSCNVDSQDGDKNDATEAQNEIRNMFAQANVAALQSLGGGEVLLGLCLSIPAVSRYRLKYEEASTGNKPLALPSTHSEAVMLRNSLPALSSDIALVSIALALPVLEPLTPSKISQLSAVTISCLCCAVSTAIACSVVNMGVTAPKQASSTVPQASSGAGATAKEDESDSLAVGIVEKALDIYGKVGDVLKHSTKGGGHIYQNHLLLGAWVVVGGLQGALGASGGTPSREDKGKSPSKVRDQPRVNLIKVQQGFGVLSVALASQSLPLLGGLLQDLQIEAGLTGGSMENTPAPADLNILGNYSALQRVMRVLQCAPVVQLYTYIATVSYRKACALKRVSKHPLEGDALSQSDSTTYYNDIISCSDDSETEEEDSESYLGLWFKETLAPESDDVAVPEVSSEQASGGAARLNTIVPDKDEPHEYLELSTSVFRFLDTYLSLGALGSSCSGGYLARYIQTGLTEQQMCLLAAILRDLDRDTARNESGLQSGYCALWQTSSIMFAQSLSRYIHNMVASGALGDTLQAALLAHLGVSPWLQDCNLWPLQVYSHTLAVLAQVVLLKPQQEKEAACISVWTRLVNTLVESVCTPGTNMEDGEDINVEHAQLLIFLFHSLNLMQKKSLLLLTAGGVIRCSLECPSWASNGSDKPAKDSQVLLLSRFLLLLEYIMKHLYDAPQILLEQIQWNLFSVNNSKYTDKRPTRMFTQCKEIEDNYRKLTGLDDCTIKPRFYSLSNVEYTNQDSPKLDGLACNFILGTPDKLKYAELVDALIRILNVTNFCVEKCGYQTLCAVQYCFSLCWRLLIILPPSSDHINEQCSDTIPRGTATLHSLIWGPRAANTKTFSRWLTDCLVKQGMYTQNAESLLRSVSSTVNESKYDVDLAIKCIQQFVGKSKFEDNVHIKLTDILLLDSILGKIQMVVKDVSGIENKTPADFATQALMVEFIPYLVDLIKTLISACYNILAADISETDHVKAALMPHLFALSSQRHPLTTDLSAGLWALLPAPIKGALDKYKNMTVPEINTSAYNNDIIPSESYILAIINTHINSLSSQSSYSVIASLKNLLKAAVSLLCQHVKCIQTNPAKSNPIADLFVALALDVRAKFLYDSAKVVVEQLVGDENVKLHQLKVYYTVLSHSYKLIVEYSELTTSEDTVVLDEKVLHCIFKFWEKMLDKEMGQFAMYQFFSIKNEGSLVEVLLSIGSMFTSQVYSTKVLHFFNKLFQASEKSDKEFSLEELCNSIAELASVDSERLQGWLRQVLLGTPGLTRSPSSSSSNVPTPTNTAATASSIPSVEKESTPKPDSTSSDIAEASVEPRSASAPSGNEVTGADGVTGTGTVTGPDSLWAVQERSHSAASQSNADDKNTLQENGLLLQALTNYIVTGNKVTLSIAPTILQALIPLGSEILCPTQECLGFPQLMSIMATLADSNFGKGHTQLFTAVTEWLEICKQYLLQKDILEKLESGVSGKHTAVLESSSCLLNYLGDLLHGLGGPSGVRSLSPPWEGELPPELPDEWLDELQEEDDSGADDSDEDSLSNKLCTFTVTQKEFMNQHWYHCHTCKMLDGVGVCTVCARVCHRGHDISYAKYGNFFCDCGAKEDNTCQALSKRGVENTETTMGPAGATNSEHLLPSSLRCRASSPIIVRRSSDNDRQLILAKHIDSSREFLKPPPQWRNVTDLLLSMTDALLPALNSACARNSTVGCHKRAQAALAQLHLPNKKFTFSDKLMVPTLGSQEGAFENVRMSYSGEQGATIRQLLSAHMIRRVAMCCLSSSHGKRQHLAVSHEKGKITVLQLSALLKQADTSKKKLTLTRLSSAPIPFTVLSLTSNPCNEDFLAVCGLKECHVLTFSSIGAVSDHLVLHPQLETGNFIIRAMWLPGSQTILALVTADFVKIYDLGKDALSPQYYFLVPSGKVRDCTFVCQDGVFYMLLMASVGYIYTQPMVEESHAKHGPFYVTNTLELNHPDITDVKGQVGGGGVSIYYSHCLQMLFFSYTQGKSFMTPMYNVDSGVCCVVPITLTSGASKTTSKGAASTPQPLCQWSEVPGHPGLVCSTLQTSNNPVVLMLNPDTVVVQEIKVLPAKAKIMDMVAIRHAATGLDNKTTLILLCEDGSLRIYAASAKYTGYWLSPAIQPTSALTPKSIKKSSKKSGSKASVSNKSNGSLQFPIDFFEHCISMNDVEFGGNDLLQIYNHTQLKHRLNSTGMYVASTKSTGFTLEITNSDSNLVICGIRVLLGNQDVLRTPGFVEVLGRNVQTTCVRTRWFDVPFTREQSLQADKKISVLFGPSQDPDGVIMIDSVKVYGKTKEVFGWPEEPEDAGSSSAAQATVNQTSNNAAAEPDTNTTGSNVSGLDKTISGMLEVVEGSFSMCQTPQSDPLRSLAISTSTKLLTMPTPVCIQMNTKLVLSALYPNRTAYHAYKDQALLAHVIEQLAQMRSLQDPRDVDPEAFYRIVLIVRGIATSRPANLAKYTSNLATDDTKILMNQLMDAMWMLHAVSPSNLSVCPVVVPGLPHAEVTIHALVEIIHAYTLTDLDLIGPACQLYVQLLLCEDSTVSFSAKHALIRVLRPRVRRRRVFIPSPPACSTPQATSSTAVAAAPPSSSAAAERFADVETVDPIGILGADGPMNPHHNLASLEALLAGAGQGVFPQPMLDIPPDADDETMMELAIALSMQDQEGDMQALQQGLQGLATLQNLGGQLQGLQVLSVNMAGAQGGNHSDTTASAGDSDDEGSNAATDGSTLRTSPAEQGGSIGSESGCSGADSIGGVSGRSSSYGDHPNPSPPRQEVTVLPQPSTSTEEEPKNETEIEGEGESASRLHQLRLSMLNKMVYELPQLKTVGGARAIPFMQVLLILTSDLNGNNEKDSHTLTHLLNTIVEELNFSRMSKSSSEEQTDSNVVGTSDDEPTDICTRTNSREVNLVLMRLLSVLMSRWKQQSKAAGPQDNSAFVARTTANVLCNSGVIEYCHAVLQYLLSYWSNPSALAEAGSPAGVTGALLKEHLSVTPPDMQPFFLKQYVKGHAADVFEDYPQLLTEMAVRLPYQIHKHTDTVQAMGMGWQHTLCEYMMNQQTPFVRKQVRKLLLFLCGHKDKYRQVRDIHSLQSHLKAIRQCCDGGVALPYDSLVELVEHLKACLEVASTRTGNWQRFCVMNDTVLPFLMQASCILDEGVSPTILQLLQSAICATKSSSPPTETSRSTNSVTPSLSSNASSHRDRRDREKSEESDSSDSKFDESQCIILVNQINSQVSGDVLQKLIKTFLLETNNTNARWQAHALVLAIYTNSSTPQQEFLLDLLWKLWPLLPAYGRRTAQFVDLLGYFSLKTADIGDKMGSYMAQAVSVLQAQNNLLGQHSNAQLYSSLSQYVELEGYYLESEPCLVCNNPEIPLSNIKLSSIKIDSKFTTTTTIVKLVSSHTISKITLRIADLKRTKMVRVINIYYNNRSVQAVVELKNKPAMWHKAKKVTLQSNQTEVKIDFPLPITACNLMIEYADFYETMQGSSESLQCPRCSAAVPANPGVCGNCGENVFQCHKCRAINYDEKDPFLCHACGFCKYAKFDYTLLARPCCAVDSIENDDDRRKTVQNINTSLEKADRVYQQLIGNKPVLELLVKKISEHRSDLSLDEVVTGSVTSTTSQVNKVVQLLAQKYCVESKNYFEELSKILQRVEASRKELVAYDRKQMDFPVSNINIDIIKHTPVISQSLNRCFGCALAATEHCLTLLRAMASFAPCRLVLCGQGLLQELVNNNLRGGTGQIQEEVRQLLCLLTRDVPQATQTLCALLVDRITLALKAQVAFSDFNPGVRHEMALLAALVTQEDSCWEQKLRTVMKLFMLACNEPRSPAVMEAIVLPCLRILQSVVSPPQPTSEINKDKTLNSLASVCPPEGITVNLAKWLNGDPTQTFSAWKQRMPKKTVPPIPETAPDTPVVVADISVPPPTPATATAPPANSEEVKEETAPLPASTKKTRQLKMHDREYFLKEKYYSKWSNKIQRLHGLRSLNLDGVWLKSVLFSPRSRLARQVACTIVQSLSQTHERHREMLLLLTGFLPEISHVGKCSDEFLSLYKSLTEEAPWKQYLALKGVLTQLADLLTHEIQEIHRLEETTLTADIAQGYALKQLTELLSSFMDDLAIRQVFKGRLVGAVLGGFLSLKSLVVQRTRLIDDTQERLLEMLEEMTTGTEAETKAFMSVCIETVQKYSPLDVRTPVFIFERLCSIIYPEENDIGEFYLSLEKDPQQEDFLQGRMLGNPYSSTEAGLGPLMRDVKNKICQDCELVALLEDDNGMELLVNNKIMSLDLPVKEVYKKVWLGEGCEGESMRVVYRMRGLLGDATEEFVETLHAKAQQAVDNEELYRMANVLADCGGLQIMLDRLNAIQNVSRARPLLQVLLKLFRLCVKVRRCQEVLCRPELGAVAVFLKILQLCLQSESDAQQAAVTEQLLDIMETILSKAANESLASFLQFSSTFGGPEYIQALLSCTNSPSVRNNQAVLDHLTKVVAALVYGNDIKMAILCEHFRSTLDFNKFDTERTSEDEFKLELFCVLCCGIEKNCIGGTLKDYIISLGIVKSALEYITMHAPCVKPTLLRTDSDELKEFISKPALKYILRFLTGLAAEHEATQLAVSQDIIPIIHRLEQVSSDEHVGSLAENLLEALRTDPATAARVQQVREFTRAEKKRLAMAMREKQLGALGMRTNDKGQVTAKSTILQQMEELGEETGLVCVICREGYKCQPTKVLCIYTFSKRCNVEDYDSKARWTMGYTTVTHFNVVHVDCHISAVRLARVRDEWESAGLQNANTRCNGLLPLWGPQVPELAFVSCLARHDSYLQDSTGHRDIGYASTVHDLKLLLLRFAQEKSFHEDAGGGGPQSNMHLVPYLIHMALYVINTTRMTAREEKNISSFLENSSPEKWIESAHEADGPLYVTTMAMLLHPPSKWRQNRMMYLKRLIILAHTRRAHHIGPVKSLGTNKAPYNYPVYKAYLMFFAMIGLIYQHFFKSVSEDESWPVALAAYIRRSDEQLLRSSEALLTAMNEELLPCTSFQEFCDVAELLEEISDCDSFIKDLLNGLP